MRPRTIVVKYSGGTHVASLPSGERASATSGYVNAARSLTRKVFPGEIVHLTETCREKWQVTFKVDYGSYAEGDPTGPESLSDAELLDRCRAVLSTARLELLDSSRRVDFIDELLAQLLLRPRGCA